jgi:3'-phosphoadenosine 5'-phosphosulfate (PAPS) 3'-phosphatase
MQLKHGEKTDKEDDSPVTVADYGAQALVAWSLRRAFPGQPLSLVAEEDAVDLREPSGAAMLDRITSLVNEALAIEHPQVQMAVILTYCCDCWGGPSIGTLCCSCAAAVCTLCATCDPARGSSAAWLLKLPARLPAAPGGTVEQC